MEHAGRAPDVDLRETGRDRARLALDEELLPHDRVAGPAALPVELVAEVGDAGLERVPAVVVARQTRVLGLEETDLGVVSAHDDDHRIAPEPALGPGRERLGMEVAGQAVAIPERPDELRHDRDVLGLGRDRARAQVPAGVLVREVAHGAQELRRRGDPAERPRRGGSVSPDVPPEGGPAVAEGHQPGRRPHERRGRREQGDRRGEAGVGVGWQRGGGEEEQGRGQCRESPGAGDRLHGDRRVGRELARQAGVDPRAGHRGARHPSDATRRVASFARPVPCLPRAHGVYGVATCESPPSWVVENAKKQPRERAVDPIRRCVDR